ncbi:MAG: Lrp/AsnC family transcriptional regulator [Gammaproteobacteria bacterium]|nr:Lrp/AsnC family transcriptional regulator [Gammaproteobacteria bacterium]MYE80870.1 Lrp/AsnC family transcriptional regulator [Gammaproteobacteria bacterium]
MSSRGSSPRFYRCSSLRLVKLACQRKTVPAGTKKGKWRCTFGSESASMKGGSVGGRSRDVPVSLDDIDRALIEHLRTDGRMPNKRLAKHLSISEATVANRIRRLQEESVLRVLLRRDLYSKGFDLQCFAEVSVVGRSVERVASDLVEIERATSVNLLLGTPEIMLVFNAVDREDLLGVLENEIAAVEGVARVELHTAIDIRKYKTGYARLVYQS